MDKILVERVMILILKFYCFVLFYEDVTTILRMVEGEI
jgi:hypothetical protein